MSDFKSPEKSDKWFTDAYYLNHRLLWVMYSYDGEQ
uniref:Uncharacterized protein n=1 Tax=Arundo donax TaxID=35708 RepID=A0A0A8YWE1_ARUDO